MPEDDIKIDREDENTEEIARLQQRIDSLEENMDVINPRNFAGIRRRELRLLATSSGRTTGEEIRAGMPVRMVSQVFLPPAVVS